VTIPKPPQQPPRGAKRVTKRPDRRATVIWWVRAWAPPDMDTADIKHQLDVVESKLMDTISGELPADWQFVVE
jgi:hypothetical protein